MPLVSIIFMRDTFFLPLLSKKIFDRSFAPPTVSLGEPPVDSTMTTGPADGARMKHRGRVATFCGRSWLSHPRPTGPDERLVIA